MSHFDFLTSLNLGTLLIGFLIVLVGFIYFMRKRSNRHSMDGRQERNIAKDLDEGRKAPDRSPRE